MPRGVANLPLKEKAISLRKKGYSYELIKNKLNSKIPQVTLSNWLTDVPYKPNKEVSERMKYGSIKSAKTHQRMKTERFEKVRKIAEEDLGRLSKRDLMILGIGLYIGEGAKHEKGLVRFSNSDPKVIKLMLSWFKEIIGVKNKNLAIRIHCYPDNDLGKTL